jgi:phosphoribosylformylglycinamidine cyclo-ligase
MHEAAAGAKAREGNGAHHRRRHSGNLSRILPPATDARIHRDAWIVPPLFAFLQQGGHVSDDEMFRAFNMGIGLVVAVDADHADMAYGMLKDAGEDPKMIGEIVAGQKQVQIK